MAAVVGAGILGTFLMFAAIGLAPAPPSVVLAVVGFSLWTVAGTVGAVAAVLEGKL